MRFLEEKWTLFLIFILLTIVKFEQVAGDTSSEEASEEASEEESEEENSEETNGCFDIGTNCKQIKRDKLCRNSVYISITKQYCRETCDMCDDEDVTPDDQSNNNSNCKDKTSTCFQWKNNGFCRSTFYTEAQKRDNCAKTCGLC